MLKQWYRYVFLDVETTGLHHDNDDIIQIWLYEISCDGKMLSSFQSLVKPERDVASMKEIVTYITGFTLESFATAPSLQSLADQVLPYFGDDVILIGHNISFDIQFVEKYFGKLAYHASIDTFPLTQCLVHFAPSYALDVLSEYLQKFQRFGDYWKMHHMSDEKKFHDALYDCICAAVVFLYCVDYVQELARYFPVLQHVSTQVDDIFVSISIVAWSAYTGSLSLPALQKMSRAPKQFAQEAPFFADRQVWGIVHEQVGWLDHNDLWSSLLWGTKMIWSFSHKNKLDIAKRFLQNQWYGGIWFLQSSQLIDPKRFAAFLGKQYFSRSEVYFIIKYCSHLFQKFGILDLRVRDEYWIYYFLSDPGVREQHPLILCTHGGLYNVLDTNIAEYKDYTLCFFDADWWHKTYNDYKAEAYNPLYYLDFVEKLDYVFDLCVQIWSEDYQEKKNALQGFYGFMQVMLWVLSIEVKRLFTWTPRTVMQLDPILDHSAFRYSSVLYAKYLTLYESLTPYFSPRVLEDIAYHHQQLQKIFTVSQRVEKMMQGSYVQFVFHDSTQFIARPEFVDYIDHFATSYMFHSVEGVKQTLGRVSTVSQLANMLQHDHDKGMRRFFVVSAQKDLSTQVFSTLFGHKTFGSDYYLGVENVTWWSGKHIYKVQSENSFVLVWGYAFYLQLLSKGIIVDKTIVLFIKWSSESLILADLSWYGSQ
jgi:DNA polymerase III epsilon subunit-like protein